MDTKIYDGLQVKFRSRLKTTIEVFSLPSGMAAQPPCTLARSPFFPRSRQRTTDAGRSAHEGLGCKGDTICLKSV